MMRRITALVLSVVLTGAVVPAFGADDPDTVDEIHYSYGDTDDSVVVDWRGAETSLWYGPSTAYGYQAVASTSQITPVDEAGPFREAVLSGLAPDTAYHYRIGARGADHVLRTAPTGSFRWVDVGDTASTFCKPWLAQVHSLIAELQPRFVTHGGDISEANVCGVPAVHAYYVDQQAWSTSAAFQPSWGNHEYGYPVPGAPAGTPRDSFANYKGRGRLTHPQTLASDDAGLTVPPGCPAGPAPAGGPATGAAADNGCRGEDWGWFRAAGVLFISYPEVWAGALAEWRSAAAVLMDRAQRDPSIDFVITYGHRPAYSSLTKNGWDPGVRAAVDALAARFSPRPDNPDGKYVLNLGHHVHALEVFRPINGLTHLTDATGGQGVVSLDPPAENSVLRFSHLGVLAGDYDAAAHRLSLRWVCGPSYPPGDRDTCRYGDTVYTSTFTAAGAAAPTPTPAPTPTATPTPRPTVAVPLPSRQRIGNAGFETDLTGWAGRYGASSAVSVARTTREAHGGRAAIRVAAGAGARNLSSGFHDQPRWVPRTVASTYTASAWVRPKAVGQEIVLRLREWAAAGAVIADRSTTLRATSTGWQQVSVRLTAARSGGSLGLMIYAKDLDAGEWFLADDVSLTGR